MAGEVHSSTRSSLQREVNIREGYVKIIGARTQVTDELAPRITECQGVSDMEHGLSDPPRNECNKDLPPEEPLRIT